LSEGSEFWNFTLMDIASILVAALACVATIIAFEMQRRTKELNLVISLHRELDSAQWNLLVASKVQKPLKLNSFLNTLEMICAILNAKFTRQDIIEQSVLNNLAVLKTSFPETWQNIIQRDIERSAFEEIRKFVQVRSNGLDSAVRNIKTD
jgi:hypothetical protein